MEAVGIIAYLAFYLIYFAVIMVIALATYLCGAFGILTISRKLGLSGGWRGFLPVFDMYQLGKIADEDRARCYPEKKPTYWRWWMMLSYVSLIVVLLTFLVVAIAMTLVIEYVGESTAVGALTVVGVILLIAGYLLLLVGSVVMSVVQYIVFYKVYHVMAGESAVWMLILTVFVSNAYPIILLVLGLSKKFPVYTPEPVLSEMPQEIPQEIPSESVTE